MNRINLMLARLLFGIGSRIAPDVVGQWAFAQLCTTSRSIITPGQSITRPVEASQQFTLAHRHEVLYSGGMVAAFEFLPPSNAHVIREGVAQNNHGSETVKTVLLVHGWKSDSKSMHRFVSPLLSRGCRVVAVDMPGHGLSSGDVFHLPIATSAMHAVIEKLGNIDSIIAYSMGGPVVATLVAGTIKSYPALSVSKIVLISSPNAMSRVFDRFASMMRLNQRGSDSLNAMFQRLSGQAIDEFTVSSQLAVSDADVLIMHAPDDKVISFSDAVAIEQGNANVKLKPMPGLGHKRILLNDMVVKNAINFVDNKESESNVINLFGDKFDASDNCGQLPRSS